jgi:hypothetical protein
METTGYRIDVKKLKNYLKIFCDQDIIELNIKKENNALIITSKTKQVKIKLQRLIKMNTDDIKFKDLPNHDNGMIATGCGGDPVKFATEVGNALLKNGIVTNHLIEKGIHEDKNNVFCKVQKIVENVEGNKGRTDVYFEFDKDTKVNFGKLAGWRLQFNFMKWISDFKENYKKDYK